MKKLGRPPIYTVNWDRLALPGNKLYYRATTLRRRRKAAVALLYQARYRGLHIATHTTPHHVVLTRLRGAARPLTK